MSRPLRRLPLVEQTAAHLRDGFQSGRWTGALPGVLQLAGELMVSKQIVRSALGLLEQEGWIEDCGAGRRRRIVKKRNHEANDRPLRIGIMPSCPLDKDDSSVIKILLGARHAIETSGHICVISPRSLSQLNDSLTRISHDVKAVDADAWIVFAAKRKVLEWFAGQSPPVLAIGGRYQGLPVASSGTSVAPAIISAVEALLKLGHRRIVMLASPLALKPTPIPSIAVYLELLRAHGIATTDYHLPDFEESPEALEACLSSLFKITPPTALLVNGAGFCMEVLSFLASRGLQVPQDVSVICMDMEPVFHFRRPALDYFQEDSVKEYVSRITRWVNGVKKGKPDQRQVIFDAAYVPGGTTGPARKS